MIVPFLVQKICKIWQARTEYVLFGKHVQSIFNNSSYLSPFLIQKSINLQKQQAALKSQKKKMKKKMLEVYQLKKYFL